MKENRKRSKTTSEEGKSLNGAKKSEIKEREIRENERN